MAAVPGFITWTFADGEARDFTNDWVLISAALLLVATLLVALAGKRIFGAVGFAAGALVGLGVLVTLTYFLSVSIGVRQDRRQQAVRLEATVSFCEGGAQAYPEAPAFVPNTHANMLVFTQYTGAFRQSHDPELRGWAPPIFRIDRTAAVACVDSVDTELEVCRYQSGRSMRRVRRDRRVRLFSLHTGAVVVDVALPGSQPDDCAAIEALYEDGGENVKAGSMPREDTVATFLRSYVTPRR